MPSFDINRLQSISGISPPSSAVSDETRAKAKAGQESGAPSVGGSAAGSTSSANAGAGVAVEVAAPVQSGPPVDNDRVAEIRSALRDGTYPLVPTKIADAMIAAQYTYESEE